MFSISMLLVMVSSIPQSTTAAHANAAHEHWIGTWATAPQPALPGEIDTFRNQTLRLIVHTSAGGKKVRIKLSNTFGDQALLIGSAHIARRAVGPDIDPASDRNLTFGGHASTTIAARSMAVSDPVELDVPPLSDLAISDPAAFKKVVETARAAA